MTTKGDKCNRCDGTGFIETDSLADLGCGDETVFGIAICPRCLGSGHKNSETGPTECVDCMGLRDKLADAVQRVVDREAEIHRLMAEVVALKQELEQTKAGAAMVSP